MGWVVPRPTKTGAERFYAYARDLTGKTHYAGSHASEAEATAAWALMELRFGRGEVDDREKKRMTFKVYVETKFLPTYRPSLKRQRDMAYSINARYMPFFKDMPIGSISRETVRAFLVAMQDEGLKPSTIRCARADLAVIFNRAADDGYRDGSPTTRLKLTLREKPVRIRPPRPADFAKIRAELPGEVSRLFADLAVQTGLRFGEITELRPGDLDQNHKDGGYVRIERAVSDVGAKLGGGSRFVVNDLTKTGEDRTVALSERLYDRLLDHIGAFRLADSDLLFPYALFVAELETYDKTWKRPNRKTTNTTGHLPDDTFRKYVWFPALERAKVGRRWVPYELRHAYGTQALAEGANIVDVQADYGHKNLKTTQRYAHAAQGIRRDAADRTSKAYDFEDTDG